MVVPDWHAWNSSNMKTSITSSLKLTLPTRCICKWLNFNHPWWWKMQMECSHSFCLFVCCFFMRNNVYRFLVQLFAIINLNDMQSMCIHSYSSHQHAHIHLPIVAYNTMHGHKHTHTPIPSLAPYKMVMRIESRNTMSETLLPPNIPFVSAFTTHQNRFMCVLDTHTSSSFSRFRFHSHSRSRSARYSFIFRFYSIEHVLSERCTIKSD